MALEQGWRDRVEVVWTKLKYRSVSQLGSVFCSSLNRVAFVESDMSTAYSLHQTQQDGAVSLSHHELTPKSLLLTSLYVLFWRRDWSLLALLAFIVFFECDPGLETYYFNFKNPVYIANSTPYIYKTNNHIIISSSANMLYLHAYFVVCLASSYDSISTFRLCSWHTVEAHISIQRKHWEKSNYSPIWRGKKDENPFLYQANNNRNVISCLHKGFYLILNYTVVSNSIMAGFVRVCFRHQFE